MSTPSASASASASPTRSTATAESQNENLVVHSSITCDLCGQSPIFGTRYVSTTIDDFDLCETCYTDQPEDEWESYAQIRSPLSSTETRHLRPPQRNSIRTYSVESAIRQLNDTNLTFGVAVLVFRLPTVSEQAQDLEEALANNTTIWYLRIHMYRPPEAKTTRENDEVLFESIARGIASNTSVKQFVWSVGGLDRNRPRVQSSFRYFLEHNSTFVTFRLHKIPLAADSDNGEADENQFATTIFQDLQMNNPNNIQRRIRFDTYLAINETSKDIILDFIDKNPSIRHFHTNYSWNDYRIDLQIACSQQKWIKRFTNVTATKSERLQVLKECLDCETVDPLYAIYHVLRYYPTGIF